MWGANWANYHGLYANGLAQADGLYAHGLAHGHDLGYAQNLDG